ncbi:hypothetical protein Acsp03_27430 [Actinomadura sp. NBRC 104412]|uniref:hypothetical protein n=1 Tax=Actinomadura sp. NBRC 104412 TaxID=3032203 RepID=UPI0024A1595E|nr:hypothetical protein [Actinomadura sp. NBRC 104412]GLZ05277.1 hypothetical protein Acsp03_27430 [Actinomadura sp. NBRC 104412]
MLPTPRTSDTNGPGTHGQGGPDLRTAVMLLPTPRATDGTKGGPNQRGSKGDLMLPSAVTLLPTPTARDGKGTDLPTRTGGPSLPTLLAGDATRPPSPDGSTSPAGQLQIPLNPDEPDGPG